MSPNGHSLKKVILALGKSGNGKSFTAGVFGAINAIASSSSISVTSKVEVHESDNYVYIDTPGFDDSDEHVIDEDTEKHILHTMRKHGIINLTTILWFVINDYRATQSYKRQARFIESLARYHKGNVWDNTIIVVKGISIDLNQTIGPVAAASEILGELKTQTINENPLANIGIFPIFLFEQLSEKSPWRRIEHTSDQINEDGIYKASEPERILKRYEILMTGHNEHPITLLYEGAKCAKCSEESDPRLASRRCHGEFIKEHEPQFTKIHPKSTCFIHPSGTSTYHPKQMTSSHGGSLIKTHLPKTDSYHPGKKKKFHPQNPSKKHPMGTSLRHPGKLVKTHTGYITFIHTLGLSTSHRGTRKLYHPDPKMIHSGHISRSVVNFIKRPTWSCCGRPKGGQGCIYACCNMNTNTNGSLIRGAPKFGVAVRKQFPIQDVQTIIIVVGRWCHVRDEPCSRKYDCCGQKVPAPACIEIYTCCLRSKVSEGCKDIYKCCGGLEPCFRQHDCCGKDVGTLGCKMVYECCNKDVNSRGCEDAHKCCMQEIGSPGCTDVCKNCRSKKGTEGCEEFFQHDWRIL
ncbi:14709_t:CDS:2 [Cetraspora pellucida]|uniref:14709_t:CDS:1 n=1 Tax=Cetraspora pellucida TaxID=1433469 RepID=A0ACA9P582_9GLOM|nr:14709_t:CDS:2 [Cetraspora pellucida]